MEFPVLLTGDLHVSHRNLHLFKIFSGQVEALAPDFRSIVIIGDLFDSQDATKWEAILTVYEFLAWLYTQNKSIYLLSGTHDTLFLNRTESTLSIFSPLANVIRVRTEFECCTWLPHSRDLNRDVEFLEAATNIDACFSHHMVRGLQIGNFVVPAGLPLELLQKFDWAFNGHIHQPQVSGTFFNVGSPWQHSFAEANQNKYLWLWDRHSVKPLASEVEPQFFSGSFSELRGLNLEGKSVRVFLEQTDDLERVVEFLTSAGALRWELCSPTLQPLDVSPLNESYQLEDLVERWANAKNLSADETSLGKTFLKGMS